MPYCEAFIKGDCLAGKQNKIKKLLPHEMPFWDAPDPERRIMAYPQTQWPDCSQAGNIVLDTPKGVKPYFLGHIDYNAFLSIYNEGQVIQNIAKVTPKGSLIKQTENPQGEVILSHFKKIERFLTPKGGLFTVNRTWDGNLVYDGKFGFEKSEMDSMRRQTLSSKLKREAQKPPLF